MSSPFFGLPLPRTMGNPGTPGINPNAPDPRIPRGPGLDLAADIPQAPPLGATVPQQMPQMAREPEDLSDMGALGKLGLVLGDVSAGLSGNFANAPSQMALDRRRKQYEAKRAAFLQGLGIMQEMEKRANSVPVAQRAALRKGQRDMFVQWGGPGSEAIYDAFNQNDDGRIQAMIEAAGEDEGAKLLLATGSVDDLGKYLTTDEGFLQRKTQLADDKELPGLKALIPRLVNEPGAKAEAERLMKEGGGFTVDDLKLLNQKYGTDGPAGTRLSPQQMAVAERNELGLVGTIDGFTPRAEAVENRKREMDEASKMRIEENKQKMELEYNTALAKAGPQISPAMRDIMKIEHKEAVGAIANTDAALDYLKELDRSLNKAEAVLTDKPVDDDLPVSKGKIDLSDASEKRVNTGKTRFVPGMGLGQSVTNTDDYSILEQAYGEEWVGKIRTSAPKGAFSDKEGVALERTIGGFGKGNAFNLRDIRERRQFIAELRERKIEERRQATEKRSSIAKRVELDDLGTSVTREGGSTGGATPQGDAGGEVIKQIKVNGQWVKARRVKGGWEPVQ